jgi:hypothetical protein
MTDRAGERRTDVGVVQPKPVSAYGADDRSSFGIGSNQAASYAGCQFSAIL